AQVTLVLEKAATGWNAPALSPWLERAIDAASLEFFGQPAMYMGEGGSIPFMGMLGEKLPKAQFMITGVLGPHSNAHGPNEVLHIPMGKKVTATVARVDAEHHAASVRGDTVRRSAHGDRSWRMIPVPPPATRTDSAGRARPSATRGRRSTAPPWTPASAATGAAPAPGPRGS